MSDTAIIQAEAKMGSGIGRWVMNPYFVQLFLLFFILGPFIAGAGISRALAIEVPSTATDSQNIGLSATAFFYLILIVASLKTWQDGINSKWFELSYCGDKSEDDWTVAFRLGTPVDMGEATPLPAETEAASGGQAKSGWALQTLRYKTILRPKQASGHCWEIPFLDKDLPAILAWLPKEKDFDHCFRFEGHTIMAFFRFLPLPTVKHATRGTFIRTSWTQDPDGTVIPIGIFDHNDLIVNEIRDGMEVKLPDAPEVHGLAQARDNYYRQQLTLEIERKDRQIKTLKDELENARDWGYEFGAALVRSMKDRRDKEIRGPVKVGRKSQIVLFGIIATLIVIGVLGMLGRL